MTKNYMEAYLDAEFPSLDECVVFRGGEVFFTPTGIRRFRERFARAGFDLRRIRTEEDFDRALVGSWHVEVEMASRAYPPPKTGSRLERQLLEALLAGDDAAIERCRSRLVRARALKIVESSPEHPPSASGGAD